MTFKTFLFALCNGWRLDGNTNKLLPPDNINPVLNDIDPEWIAMAVMLKLVSSFEYVFIITELGRRLYNLL